MESNEEVTIRTADPLDAESIAEIWRSGLRLSLSDLVPSEEESVSAFQSLLQFPPGKSCIFVAESGGQVVGWQGLHDLGNTSISPIAQSSTYISKEWRSKSLGKKLLSHACTEAGKMGFWYVIGWIRSDNVHSIRLVESLGWSPVGKLPERKEQSAVSLTYYAIAVS